MRMLYFINKFYALIKWNAKLTNCSNSEAATGIGISAIDTHIVDISERYSCHIAVVRVQSGQWAHIYNHTSELYSFVHI